VTLTVTEFLILQALATRPGVVKSRNALMDAAYDDQVYVDDRTIDSHIKRLRKKFKAVDDDFEMIETLYGLAIVSRSERQDGTGPGPWAARHVDSRRSSAPPPRREGVRANPSALIPGSAP